MGGIVFSWISILYAVSGIKGADIIAGKTVNRWSKNTNTIYIAQWLLIGWLSRLELIDVPAEPFINLTLGIVIFILSDVAAYLFLILKKKTLATKKAKSL